MAPRTSKAMRTRSVSGSAGRAAVSRPETSVDVATAPAAPPISARSSAPAAPEIRQLLTFFASGYEYAVSILNVREIAEYRALTPVPGTPAWIRGVMNLRGTVVPVIDLAAKLGMAAATITRRTCLLIVDVNVNAEAMVLAVMVDGVSRVVDLSPSDLQDVPSFGPRIDTTFLLGMTRLENRLVLLLDINRIVECEDVLATAAAFSAIDGQQPEVRP